MSPLEKALRGLVAGPPWSKSARLSSSAFVPVRARRLKRAKVLWVNWSFFRDRGVAIDGALTPALERLLLEAFAWAIPSPNDPDHADAFVGAPRTFYADRYGGDGIGLNAGSGRAAAVGEIQIKGIGRTPLVHKDNDFEHGHGALVLSEAIREAAWGELSHREVPYGANRVIAIVDTGAVIHLPDGRRRRTALLIRPFPVRPAHFMFNFLSAPHYDTFQSQQRRILEALPQPAVQRRGASPPARLRAGFFELADRLAGQHAAMMARRTTHGALSASNVELSGQLLDYGTQSTLPGHGSTVTIRGSLYHSGAQHYMLDNLRSLAFAVRLGLPRPLARGIPDNDALFQRFKLAHARTLLAGLVELCGIPVFAMQGELQTPKYWKLATCLHALAFQKGPPVLIERRLPRWLGDYDVGSLLYCLACLKRRGARNARKLLLAGRTDEKLSAVIDAYFDFRSALDEHLGSRAGAAKNRLARDIDELVIRIASVRNQKRPSLYLRSLNRENSKLVRAYQESSDRALVADRVESLIADNRRFFADESSQCVIREWEDRVSASRVRYAYEPVRGYTLSIALASARPVAFFHRPLPAQDLAARNGAAADVVAIVALRGRDGRVERKRVAIVDREVSLPIGPDVVSATIALAVGAHAKTGNAPFALLPPNYYAGENVISRHGTLATTIARP